MKYRDRQALCKKKMYRTKKSAQRALAQFIYNGVSIAEMEDLNAYKCDRCKGWHIGHYSKYLEKMRWKSTQK